MKKFPRLSCVASLLATLLPLSVFAQNEGGFTVQEKPGIALVKPQAWSKNDQATVMEFEAFTDRTVKGTPGAGYYEFKTKASDKRQVPAAKVVKLLVFPDPSNFQNVVSKEEREQIAILVKELKEAVAQYPSSQTYVSPSLKKLEAEISQYDSGKVKVAGVWQAREAFLSGQITTLNGQLRGDLVRAKPSSSFDLNADPRFLALQELAGNSPSANAVVKELTALRDKLSREESRNDLLVRLAEPSISLAEAKGAIERLKALQPEEDAKTVAFIKKWEAGESAIKAMKDAALPLNEAVETELTAIQVTDTPPQLSTELATKIAPLRDQVRAFSSSNPPPVLVMENKEPVALAQISEGFIKLQPIFQEKRFLDAKEIIDNLVGKAEVVGPQTVRIVGGLQAFAGGKIEQFSRQREEAKLLLDSGKKDEALAKFEEAFATIPDNGVGEQIAQLKPAEEKKN